MDTEKLDELIEVLRGNHPEVIEIIGGRLGQIADSLHMIERLMAARAISDGVLTGKIAREAEQLIDK